MRTKVMGEEIKTEKKLTGIQKEKNKQTKCHECEKKNFKKEYKQQKNAHVYRSDKDKPFRPQHKNKRELKRKTNKQQQMKRLQRFGTNLNWNKYALN